MFGRRKSLELSSTSNQPVHMPPKTTGKIEVFKGSDDEWYWRLKGTNGRIVAQSEGYQRRNRAVASAMRVRDIASRARLVVND